MYIKKLYNVFLVLLLANVAVSVPQVYSQEEFLCPKQYETHNRIIALQDQHLTKSQVISKAICSYFEQNTSKTTFEIRWSSTGNLHAGEWCTDKLVIENGIGKYQSESHYVQISSTGILPSEYDDAKDFMQLLFVIVKDDAKSCNEIENFIIIEKSQQINTEIKSDTIKENKTVDDQTQLTITKPENSEQELPIGGIIAGSAIVGIGYVAIKKYKSKQ